VQLDQLPQRLAQATEQRVLHLKLQVLECRSNLPDRPGELLRAGGELTDGLLELVSVAGYGVERVAEAAEADADSGERDHGAGQRAWKGKRRTRCGRQCRRKLGDERQRASYSSAEASDRRRTSRTDRSQTTERCADLRRRPTEPGQARQQLAQRAPVDVDTKLDRASGGLGSLGHTPAGGRRLSAVDIRGELDLAVDPNERLAQLFTRSCAESTCAREQRHVRRADLGGHVTPSVLAGLVVPAPHPGCDRCGQSGAHAWIRVAAAATSAWDGCGRAARPWISASWRWPAGRGSAPAGGR